MGIQELIKENRSYRRFRQEEHIDRDVLEQLVDLARLSPSGANMQPLKYILSCETGKNEMIFPHLRWAGYLKSWPGPMEGERPSAYIIILGDRTVTESFGCDHGIAAQSMMLGAAERRLGGCMIASIQREKLRKVLDIQDHLEILLVLALGRPKERVVIEGLGADGDIKYWRDADSVHHVPKRSLDDIIID
jgi:nitroreductase